MARVKYSEEAEPLTNKHFGYTFQRNRNGNSMNTASRSTRTRYSSQFQRMQNLQKAVRFWRTMSPATKAAWQTFATMFPQPSKKNPANFLSGYQLFLKRNHYVFLMSGIDAPFMENPELVSLPPFTAVYEIVQGDNCLDMTDIYIKNFGLLPVPGQFILMVALPMSSVSGQFFPVIIDKLEVSEVYIDGFFLNIILPPEINNILFSIYLSKPISPGQSYTGTKVRFMGCFSTKKFSQLEDVPAITPADFGKVWGVDPVTHVWSLITPAGGSNFLEICVDFDNPCEFIYSVPCPMKITSVQSESTAPTLLPVMETVLAKYDNLSVVASAAGLVILQGEIL